jgi:fatty-acyl-CoA synthase
MDEGSHVTFGGYYKNKGATQKKILRNVFKKGDA